MTNLIVSGIEGGSYVATEEKLGPDGHAIERKAIKNDDGKTKCFSGIEQVRDHFDSGHYEQAFLEHRSAYDEIIGNSAAVQPARMALHW